MIIKMLFYGMLLGAGIGALGWVASKLMNKNNQQGDK
jgi:hypothetical protein